jgi:hypothetical protein
MVAERRMRCPPQEHGSASNRPSARRGGPAVRIPAVPWSPCLHPRSASKCPVSGVSVQCPRRAMSTRPVSVSGRPGVRVWTFGVPRRCPRVPRRRLRCPHWVTSWSASARRAATRPGGPGSGRPAISANGAGRAGPAATLGRTWPSSWEALGQRARVDRLTGQGHAG